MLGQILQSLAIVAKAWERAGCTSDQPGHYAEAAWSAFSCGADAMDAAPGERDCFMAGWQAAKGQIGEQPHFVYARYAVNNMVALCAKVATPEIAGDAIVTEVHEQVRRAVRWRASPNETWLCTGCGKSYLKPDTPHRPCAPERKVTTEQEILARNAWYTGPIG